MFFDWLHNGVGYGCWENAEFGCDSTRGLDYRRYAYVCDVTVDLGGTSVIFDARLFTDKESTRGVDAETDVRYYIVEESHAEPFVGNRDVVQTRNQRMQIQMFLKAWAYGNCPDPGPVDGIFGPRTRAALRCSQSTSGWKDVEANGLVDEATRYAMYVEVGGYDGPRDGSNAEMKAFGWPPLVPRTCACIMTGCVFLLTKLSR